MSPFVTHLAELLSITVWDECFKRLESRVDALHAPTLVAVGNLSADSPLLVAGCFWGQRNVGQTEEEGRRTRVKGISQTLKAIMHIFYAFFSLLVVFLFISAVLGCSRHF